MLSSVLTWLCDNLDIVLMGRLTNAWMEMFHTEIWSTDKHRFVDLRLALHLRTVHGREKCRWNLYTRNVVDETRR